MANTNYVQFVSVALLSTYEGLATKDNNTLYFVESTGQLFKGSKPYGHKYEVVAEKPVVATAKQGVTYVVSGNKGVYFYDGTNIVTICPPIATTISDTSTDDEVASAKAVNEAIKKVTSDASALTGRVSTLESEMDTAQGDIAQLKTDVVAAKKAGDEAQADVDALEIKVGAVTEGKTVVEMIAEVQAATTYDDTAVKADIKKNTDAIDVLNGTGAGSVSKQVADAVASIIAEAPEAYDTLKEISDWISSHTSDASAMNTQINANKEDIAELVALVGSLPEGTAATTIVEYIDSKVEAVDFTAEINAAKQAAIEAAAADATSKANQALADAKTYADGIDAKVTILNGNDTVEGSVDNKIKQAKEAINADVKAVSDRVTTVEGKVTALESDNTTNKQNIAGNTSEINTLKDTTIPNAIQTAKDYADGLDTAMDARVGAVESALTWQVL